MENARCFKIAVYETLLVMKVVAQLSIQFATSVE